MTLKYGKFEMPDKVMIDDAKHTSTFARFFVEPLEKGFGHTLGNSLRRIMLSSLEAPSIMSIRIEGVPHEYMAVDGIIEDMTRIVLNLKGALLRYLPLEEDEKSTRRPQVVTKIVELTQDQLDKAKGSYVVTLGEIIGESHFEVVNPELPLFTATKPFKRRIDVRIGIGRGYVPSERHTNFDKMHEEIIIDSIFSPVRLVNFLVEHTRVGQDTDFDKLILDVTTDGRITPEEALTFAAQIGIQHFEVFDALKMHDITFEKEDEQANKDRDEILHKLCLKINEIELSVRSTNCLAGANIETIGELVVMPESEMLRFRNFGKKSLTEIKEKLEEMGLCLGMDLSRYGINRDNIASVIQNYQEEQAGMES